MKVILCERMEQEESDVAVVGTKGQIVIPQRFRKQLKISPKTKMILYRKDDKLVLAKLSVPTLEKLEELFSEIDAQNKCKTPPTEQKILEEIQAYRQEKRDKQGA
jgi:AbrB family looped-hinge helix DNA binding protein